jgi:hypothetical protein
MNKELTVPKWVLINHLKIPQIPPNLSAQIVCPSLKLWDFDEKILHWASVVRVSNNLRPFFGLIDKNIDHSYA